MQTGVCVQPTLYLSLPLWELTSELRIRGKIPNHLDRFAIDPRAAPTTYPRLVQKSFASPGCGRCARFGSGFPAADSFCGKDCPRLSQGRKALSCMEPCAGQLQVLQQLRFEPRNQERDSVLLAADEHPNTRSRLEWALSMTRRSQLCATIVLLILGLLGSGDTACIAEGTFALQLRAAAASIPRTLYRNSGSCVARRWMRQYKKSQNQKQTGTESGHSEAGCGRVEAPVLNCARFMVASAGIARVFDNVS